MNNSFEVSFLVLEAQEVTDAICQSCYLDSTKFLSTCIVQRRKLRVLCPLYFTGNRMDTNHVACDDGVSKYSKCVEFNKNILREKCSEYH